MSSPQDTGRRLYRGSPVGKYKGAIHIQIPSDAYHPERTLCGIADLSDSQPVDSARFDQICDVCARVYAAQMLSWSDER